MKLSKHSNVSPAIVSGTSIKGFWHRSLSFLVRWHLAPIASQFIIHVAECTPRQPNHRSTRVLDTLRDSMKFSIVCLRLIFRLLSIVDKKNQRRELVAFPFEPWRNPKRSLLESRSTQIAHRTTWRARCSFEVDRNLSLRSIEYLDGYSQRPSLSQRSQQTSVPSALCTVQQCFSVRIFYFIWGMINFVRTGTRTSIGCWFFLVV